MYRPFVESAGVVYDVGASVGVMTRAFLDAGARRVIPYAVGAVETPVATFRLCAEADALGTLVPGKWEGGGRFPGYHWPESLSIEVSITTLDALIAVHGVPQFIKIDTEGYEPQVLRGLSVPVPALSFEHAAEHLDDTALCVERLSTLGAAVGAAYEYNWPGNASGVGALPSWVPGPELLRVLRQFGQADPGFWTDIYARRQGWKRGTTLPQIG